uniref:Heat shock factor protein 5 n=1 Tax=Crocodylus porosus TaxID=8502 RepID=A0A7M4EKM9_CROPO
MCSQTLCCLASQTKDAVPPESPRVICDVAPLLAAPINPNNFPAKLWRLVNSPRFRSIRWDARGEGLLIDQPLFEAELLGLFKTTNFTSFIRQLNLYGFRKVVLGPPGGSPLAPPASASPAGPLHHFHSPHFRRDRPDLLVHLKRLTSANKAKLAAGLEVTSLADSWRTLGRCSHGFRESLFADVCHGKGCILHYWAIP